VSETQTHQSLEAWFRAHGARIRDELFEFLRIPSVSTQPDRRGDVARAAEWLEQAMQRVGLSAEVHPTAGHPVVLGEWRGAPPGAPTILVYGHYDVQPAEPLDLWHSPAFEPEVRDGRIYARGATDDKGQLFLHLKAIEALLALRGALPVNVIVLAEGEEETGSDHLADFIAAQAERLRCDAVVISDSTMFAPGMPALLSALRGIAGFEIFVDGPSGDLHSGTYGGAVVNPAMALARILATLHDENGRIAIPGFYDRVREWPAEWRRRIAELPFDDAGFRAEAGVRELGGEREFSVLERVWMRPTCEVNGLIGGYTGEGSKTVLPARASAKITCRLVPDQDPGEIARLFRAHLERVTPPGVQVRLDYRQGSPGWRADLPEWLLGAARRATRVTFGREPSIVADGGSLPVVTDFERLLGAPTLLLGFGLPGENAHAPNEWLLVDNFERGMLTIAILLDELREVTPA
jgi:acetylornithine deacetylase/succinyl-diaminopimelate desuccinylase-like protein